MRPSDSVLRCHVGRSPQGDDQSINDEHSDTNFSGDHLANDLGWLNISSLASSRHNSSIRRMDTDSASSPDYPVLFMSKINRSLNTVPRTSRDAAGSSSVVVPAFTTKCNTYGTDRTAKYREAQKEEDDAGLPPDLVNVIFGGITRRKGNKRLAQLQLGDSGRWRIVRYYKTPGAFP